MQPIARSRLSPWVWLVAAALATLLIIFAGRYGPHRDELYFVVAGSHLAWGYPDQPPLTPAIAGLMGAIAPGSLTMLRLPSAIMMAATVVIAAMCARELAGGRAAQLLAAVVTASSALTIVLGHLLSTTTFDTLAWSVIIWLALRTLLRDEPRGWLAVGAALGIALENKTLVLGLVVTLMAGVVITPATRHHVRSRWWWLGGLLAAVLWLPNVIWQASHGWPQLSLASDIQGEYGVLGERIAYVALQLVQVSPLATVLWVYGLVRLVREPSWRAARPVAWSYVLLAVIFMIAGGKPYYVAGLMPVLVAAGATSLARRWSVPRLRTAGIALLLVAAVAWPVGLPVLPVATWVGTPYAVIGEDSAETVGWPAFVRTVRLAVTGGGAKMIFTGNYGEAGALDWYGAGVPVYSGHNGFGAWGPPSDGLGPVVVVGYDDPSSDFTDCRQDGVIDNGLDLDNEEQGGAVFVCAGVNGGWGAAWPHLRHLSA